MFCVILNIGRSDLRFFPPSVLQTCLGVVVVVVVVVVVEFEVEGEVEVVVDAALLT